MTTTSNPTGRLSPWWRMASRSQRFTRFRFTAFPTFRLTVSPTRVWSVPLRTNKIITNRHRMRSPVRCTRWISTDLRNRWWRGSPSGCSSAALAGNRGHQLLSALGTAAAKNVATACGLHPSAESVGPLALDLAGLVRTLHLNLRTRDSNHNSRLIFPQGRLPVLRPRREEPDVYAVDRLGARSFPKHLCIRSRARETLPQKCST